MIFREILDEVDNNSTRLDTDKLGAYKYLKARMELTPRQRYYIPLTSSFEYGWEYPPTGDRQKFYGRDFVRIFWL